jgi:predicted nucleic acid-binding protein
MTSNNLTNQLLVADTSPLLALARIDFLESLSHLFSSVFVTQTVLNECLIKPARQDAKSIQIVLCKFW